MGSAQGNRRRYLRYRPDSHNMDDIERRAVEFSGFVDTKMEGETFDPQLVGMVMDKSHSGCAIVFVKGKVEDQLLTVGRECFLKAGPLDPLRAVIRWRRDWDEGLSKVGFEFLE